MFIRRTKTHDAKSGSAYFTYRLVESVRSGKAVRQRTLLNLGAHFDLPQADWTALTVRIEELLHGQGALIHANKTIEKVAQRYAAQLIARQAENNAACPADATASDQDSAKNAVDANERFQEVDLATLELVRPRTVGVEHAALNALRDLGLENKLKEIGFNTPQIAASLGNIIGRMAAPASEYATHKWLQRVTALGELLGFDYEFMRFQQLYRGADLLLKHRDALETHLFGTAQSLFDLNETITLYDLTNTYFEGSASGVDKAKHGRSKEKRTDCPLVTLGLVLDVGGFPKRSRMFPGNVSEPSTLESMLRGLGAVPGATVVMDAGLATEENLALLTKMSYRYVVVSRKKLALGLDPGDEAVRSGAGNRSGKRRRRHHTSSTCRA